MTYFYHFSRQRICSERGNTMLEIIAALAIMGILSIGSMWGYQTAVIRNRTNIIIDALSRRAILASNIKTQSGKANLDEFKDDSFTDAYHVSLDDGDGFFTISIQGVQDNIVTNFQKVQWAEPYNIFVKADGAAGTGVQLTVFDPTADNVPGNTMYFVFADRLDNAVRPGYPTETTCKDSGGTWKGTYCNCNGATMTSTGCTTDPSVAGLCYQDSDCPYCKDVCRNGKCVTDPNCDGKWAACRDNTPVACIPHGTRATGCTQHYDDGTPCQEGQTCTVLGGIASCISDEE